MADVFIIDSHFVYRFCINIGLVGSKRLAVLR